MDQHGLDLMTNRLLGSLIGWAKSLPSLVVSTFSALLVGCQWLAAGFIFLVVLIPAALFVLGVSCAYSLNQIRYRLESNASK